MSHYVERLTGLFSKDRDPFSASNTDKPPGYLANWELASDPKFEEGIIYMTTLNPGQPACFTMLGIACLARRDFNLASAAFRKALELGSPQGKLLKTRITECEDMIRESQAHRVPWIPILILLLGCAALVGFSI